MKLITKHNFFYIVCVSFTLITTGKLLLEKIDGFTDRYYSENIFTILVISILGTLVLATHYYLRRFPFIPVFIGQYLVTIGIVCLAIWIGQKFTDFAPSAYKDMIISVTIPFVIGAIVYYVAFFREIKKANKLLENMNH
ncbi:MAG: hypothetical protein IKR39_03980 [Lachnospiraceae bacterium]|nr:hypothetical protein [Lachnospiraceae bacterium]